jgi:hypothetical protein
VSSKGCLHGQRNELLEKGKIQERCTDDYKGQYSGRNYTFQCELGSEKSTESTPGPRLNRAAELASFWDPQRKIVILGHHAVARMPGKSSIGQHCGPAYIIDGDISSYGNRCCSLNRFVKESCLCEIFVASRILNEGLGAFCLRTSNFITVGLFLTKPA